MDLHKAVAGAVRAELARANKKPADLMAALGVSRPTVAGRLSGAYAFTMPELDKVAECLGLTTQDIMLSAALTERFGADRADEITPLAPPKADAWAQPPGSFRRRSQATVRK
ncbi:helix-turn-helix domain-containing protein [Microbacterium sp. CGR1]|uniref:helix-turn-helix domain-containing protein n=1 Tax=Microbacterium sp. CGR1 TaxID=1696072 RepID=UPI000A4AA751|nr:helix-turn-helix transcriptional regulator [Microbacterium sp. CGR1]